MTAEEGLWDEMNEKIMHYYEQVTLPIMMNNA